MKKETSAKKAWDHETPEQLRSRAAEIVRRLKKAYPHPQIALRFNNPLELLVATILSAQCTDERVNMVTETLFRKYRSARDYAGANPIEFEQEIKSTGFFRNKTKSVLGACKVIVENFGGKVPDSMDDLLTLPGVGRKTANVVLENAYGTASGIVVDTHVKRVAERLRLSEESDPDKIETGLMKLVPKRSWIDFGKQMICHGRSICQARRPKCSECVLNDICPSSTLALSPSSIQTAVRSTDRLRSGD